MNDIKQKFTPETHQTRCGKPWRWVKGDNLICVDDGKSSLLFVSPEGLVYNRRWSKYYPYPHPGHLRDYDLIPITHKPVDLPTNLREEIKYAAMDDDKKWIGYVELPDRCASPRHYWDSPKGAQYQYGMQCHDIPEDPAGWENSLHKLVDGKWERVI